jgi:hypothetical protein
MMPADQRNDPEIVCEGFPTQRGCPNAIKAGRTNWASPGTKRNGWYVTPATEDTKGTVSVPLWLCYFCPSCAVIVKAQEKRMAS